MKIHKLQTRLATTLSSGTSGALPHMLPSLPDTKTAETTLTDIATLRMGDEVTFPNHQTGIALMKNLLVLARTFWQEALEGVES